MTKQVKANTAEEALAAWDAGDEVETVEMGGLGDAYEMAIQCTAFELMRSLLADPKMLAMVRETPVGEHYPQPLRDGLDALTLSIDAKDPETGRHKLGGLSGAQAGAAQGLALNIIRNGFANAREQVPDRMIFVRKQDPVAMLDNEPDPFADNDA